MGSGQLCSQCREWILPVLQPEPVLGASQPVRSCFKGLSTAVTFISSYSFFFLKKHCSTTQQLQSCPTPVTHAGAVSAAGCVQRHGWYLDALSSGAEVMYFVSDIQNSIIQFSTAAYQTFPTHLFTFRILSVSTALGPPLQPPGGSSTSPCRGLGEAEHALIRLGKDGLKRSPYFEFTAACTRLNCRGSLTSVSQDGIGEMIHRGEIKDQSMSRRHNKQVLLGGMDGGVGGEGEEA